MIRSRYESVFTQIFYLVCKKVIAVYISFKEEADTFIIKAFQARSDLFGLH